MQGRQMSGRAVKELRAIQIYTKQKNRYQLSLFLFSNDVDLKYNTGIIENHSEVSECAKS